MNSFHHYTEAKLRKCQEKSEYALMQTVQGSNSFLCHLSRDSSNHFSTQLPGTLLKTPAAITPIGSVAVGSNGNAGGKPTHSSASLGAKADSYLQFTQKQCLKLG